jgi:tetratricopeptide (TPR) repeat protein
MGVRMMLRRTGTVFLAVGVGLLALPAQASPWRITAFAPAEAGAPDPAAVAAYEAGSNAYALGNYEEAVAQFERAFELSHRSELLFNLGQAYSRWYEISGDVGHLKKGRKLLENYVAYIDQHPDQDDPEARRQTEQRLTEIDHLIAQHDAGGDSGTEGEDTQRPVHKKAWFWVVLVGGAALIAGGVTTAVVLSRRNQDGDFDPELGTLGRGVAPGGLGFHF